MINPMISNGFAEEVRPSSFTAEQTRLLSAANEAKAALEIVAPEKVDSEMLSRIWDRLSQKIDDSFLSALPANQKLSGHQSPAQLEKGRLLKLLEKMQETGRIRFMTPEAAASMGFSQEIRAFYVPLTHHIILKKSLEENQIVDSLYHELVHAAQYTLRFPLDIRTLSTLNIADDDLLDFIDYYYESQANYRTLRLSQPKEWEPLFRYSETGSTAVAITAAVFCLPCVAVLTLTRAYSNYNALSYLPEIDINSEPGWTKPTGGKESALLLSELLLLKDSDQTPYTGTGWDTSFHQRFGKAIERTYFGTLPFLFQNDRKDQENYKALHDAYYRNIGANREFDSDLQCSILLERVQQEDSSPLVSWLTLPKTEIESCKAFSGPGSLEYRDIFLSELLRAKEKEKSPFIIIRPGSEGTKPSLRVLPQLKVSPIEKTEEKLK